MNKNSKIIIPGAAGLVGQNLVLQLKEKGYTNLVLIDKQKENTRLLRKMNPEMEILEADLSKSGKWENAFKQGDVVIMLQAQIGAPTIEPFLRNNIDSTKNIIKAMKKEGINYLIHISSSVVNSKASDFYTETKKEQEKIVLSSGIEYCILRPTLMFGWFDRKHLGWLSRFMDKVPVFPVPGDGKYMRQPLYVRDFCNIIIKTVEITPSRKIYNITGREKIDYIEIIKQIKKTKKSKTFIVKIPIFVFRLMMQGYALISKNPPFTTQQLDALITDDKFELIPWWDIFNVKETSFKDAISETFCNPKYSNIILKF